MSGKRYVQLSKTLTELTTLNKHPFIQNLRKAAQENGNRFTNTISLAATDTYGDKAVAKAKPEWGSFSGVFSDKHSVLKVYHDPAYHDFVKYAQSHQDDPHMPKIYSHVRTSDGIGLVRMEKLKDLRDGNVYDPKNPANNRTNQHFSDTGVFAPYNEELWQARTGAGLHGLLHDVPGKVMRQSQPSFHKSLSNLSFHFANKTFDMHPGNVMQRADGTPVITDPLWDEHHWVKARKGKASDLLSGKRGVLEEMMTLNKYPFKWEDRWHSTYMNNKLGSGTYAHVFDREKHNSVIKVFQNDPAYEDFLDYAKANQDNPHIPKIYAHKKLSDGTHAVRIEKLQKNPTDPKVQDLFGHPETGQEHAYIVGKDEPIFGKKNPHFNRMENVTKNFPKLVDTFHHMTATSPYHHEWDFGSIAHSHNMMWRDNTPVITDPWYSRGKPKKVLAEMMTLNKHPWKDAVVNNAPGPHQQHELGHGFYAHVYDRGKHHSVIKVYRNDEGYSDFINYAKANQDNPHIPKIYAHKSLGNNSGIVRLEKLHGSVNREQLDLPEYHGISLNGFSPKQHPGSYWEGFDRLKELNPTLHATIEHMDKSTPYTHRWDLGGLSRLGNHMRRDDGTIVLTDPWHKREHLQSESLANAD